MSAVESYLASVATRLPGSGRARTAIVAELRAGLLDAIDAYQDAGLTPDEATAVAIREFGDPARIAAGFGPELAARGARVTALALVATGPVIGLLWAVAAVTSHIGVRAAPPWRWAGVSPEVAVFVAAAFVILTATVWASLLAVAATGRLTRWMPQRPRLAPAVTAFAGFGFAAVDTIMLTVLGAVLLSTPGRIAVAPVALAAMASLVRLTMARRAARRCLAVLALPPGNHHRPAV
jgi:hypothetical protein